MGLTQIRRDTDLDLASSGNPSAHLCSYRTRLRASLFFSCDSPDVRMMPQTGPELQTDPRGSARVVGSVATRLVLPGSVKAVIGPDGVMAEEAFGSFTAAL